ncbi:MAG: hypothetical protein QM708_08675 [Propioniciclava sp.]|uniref:hypothetical protein n=1 Tax=Propioniciclava sp. TaxID=2038686 RepID=UPI0039E49313
MTTTPSPAPAALMLFRIAAGASAAVALTLGVLGSFMDADGVRGVHATLAMVFLVLSLVAGIVSFVYARAIGRKGIGMHGLSVFVLAIAQYGMGELYWTIPHIVLGLAIVLAAGALFSLSMRLAAHAAGA